LKALVKKNINDVNKIGHIMARYYTHNLDIKRDILGA